MRNIEKISTNNIFKPFKKEGQHFYVECYGVDLNVDYFVPINEENIFFYSQVNKLWVLYNSLFNSLP